MLLLVAMLLLEQAVPPPSGALTPTSVERVKRELSRPTISLESPPPAGPTFRVHVNARVPIVAPLWKEKTVVPAYVRTKRPPTHHEFLAAVTPEELRSGTLYPCCIDLVPVFEFIHDQVLAAGRSYQESRAKRSVAKALRGIGVTPKKN